MTQSSTPVYRLPLNGNTSTDSGPFETFYVPQFRVRLSDGTVASRACYGSEPQNMRNLPPEVVRERNLYHGTGETNRTHYFEDIGDNRIQALWRAAMTDADFAARRTEVDTWNRRSGRVKRGLAVTPVKFGISFTLTHYNQAGAYVLIYSDGTVQVNHGGTEMGQGLHTKMLGVAMRELGLPVFSGSVSIKGTVKETLGHINQPLVFGDEIIHPGDVIKGDADGVVVVRRAEVEEAIALSTARDANEARLIELYKQGGTTIELCNLHDVLRAKGITTDLDDVDPDQGLGAR